MLFFCLRVVSQSIDGYFGHRLCSRLLPINSFVPYSRMTPIPIRLTSFGEGGVGGGAFHTRGGNCFSDCAFTSVCQIRFTSERGNETRVSLFELQ